MTGETYRILLAEDDRFLRKAAETTLKRNGFEVITATDGEEALRAVGTAQREAATKTHRKNRGV